MPVKIEHDNLILDAGRYIAPAPALDYSPIQQAGSKLVEELARTGWQHPDFDVVIKAHGEGDKVVRGVNEISGVTEDGPFKLRFVVSMGYGSIEPFCHLYQASIPPGLDIHYYNDFSGPSLDLYVGKDWKRDGRDWMNSFRHHEKLDGKPKTTLSFSGSVHGRGSITGPLENKSDMGRAYTAEGEEPQVISGSDVAAQISAFIDGLTRKLSSRPTADGFVAGAADPAFVKLNAVEPIPAPADFPALYAWHTRDTLVQQGHHGEPIARVFSGMSGYRLIPGWPCEPGLSARTRDSFDYASTSATDKSPHPMDCRDHERLFPVKIELKNLNEVFVVDRAAYTKAREAQLEIVKASGADAFTDAQVGSFFRSMAATMTPASEYKGDFEDPFYAIGRQLRSDEARVMRGRLNILETDNDVRVVMTDKGSNEDVVIYSDEKRLPIYREALRAAETVAEKLDVKVSASDAVIEKVKEANRRQAARFDAFALALS